MSVHSADSKAEDDLPRKSGMGIERAINAMRYSVAGLRAAFVHEAAFRWEVLAAVLLVPLACWLEVRGAERALLIASVLLTLVVELLNSAIEATLDRVSSERHPLAGRAKDMGSAAVCLSIALTAAVWLSILLER
jgi:diacylglycerol kinase (ATP)